MSSRNGDKARFNKQRTRRRARRAQLALVRKLLVHKSTGDPVAGSPEQALAKNA